MRLDPQMGLSLLRQPLNLTIESLLNKDVKVFVDRYSPVVDSTDPSYLDHWNPTNQYYRLTDDSPAYVAAVALHPRFKWRWFEKRWAENVSWQIAAETAIKKQWESYKSRKIDDLLDPSEFELYSQQRGQCKPISQLEYFMEEEFESSDEEGYTEWQKIGWEKQIDNTVAYWYDRRFVWPHPARFALDLFAVPAMSVEPERVFSTGRMIRPDRGCLKADVIAAAACLRQWDRHGAITWE